MSAAAASSRRRRGAVSAAFFAVLLAAFAHWSNNVRLNPSDEGFLWYGVRQVLLGQVPVRDFQAYDPGRYYWCAPLVAAFGGGLMALRLACALFQGLALFFGTLCLQRVLKAPAAVLFAGVVALAWMLLYYRYFDAGIPMMLVYFAARLAEDPGPRRSFAAGVFTGLACFFGINHGVYAFGAVSLLMLYLGRKGVLADPRRRFLSFFSGIAFGLIPVFVMYLAVPGFAAAHWESLASVGDSVRHGAGNLTQAWPWPWTVDWQAIAASSPSPAARFWQWLNLTSLSFVFVLMLAFPFLSAAKLGAKAAMSPAKALLAASFFAAVFYLHHALSRADIFHLGESIFPVWTGFLAMAALAGEKSKRSARFLAGSFAVLSLASAGLMNNIAYKAMVPQGAMVWFEAGKDRIWLSWDEARNVNNALALVRRHAPPQEPVLLVPSMATFYCLLEKDSPIYDLYQLVPVSEERQRRMIRMMEEKGVAWVGIRPDTAPAHLAHSCPLFWEYLSARFEPLPSGGRSECLELLRKKATN